MKLASRSEDRRADKQNTIACKVEALSFDYKQTEKIGGHVTWLRLRDLYSFAVTFFVAFCAILWPKTSLSIMKCMFRFFDNNL